MSLQQLIELREKKSVAQSIWYRHILTLACGGLALLSGLTPKVPPGVGQYFLAGTWFFLGLGIIAGGAATYLEVDSANKLAAEFQNQLQKSLEEDIPLSRMPLVVSTPNKIFSLAKPVMVIPLMLAVVCLVCASIITTLSA